MEDKRNNRIVERRLRDAMQSDRARIQLGRISAFGLLELSRQRLHPSLVETNFEVCKHCSGSGLVRTVETTAVRVLRAIEEEGLRGRAAEIKVSVPTEIALYVFNHKRDMLSAMEKRLNIRIFVNADDDLIKPNFQLDVLKTTGVQRDTRPQRLAPVQSVDMSDLPDIPESEITDDSTVSEDARFEDDRGDDRGDRDGHRGGGDRGGHHRGDRGHRGDHHRGGDRGGDRGFRGGEGGGQNFDGEGGGRRRGRRGGRRRGRGRGGRDRFDRHEGGGFEGQQGGGQPFDQQQPNFAPAEGEQDVMIGASDAPQDNQQQGFEGQGDQPQAEGGQRHQGQHHGGDRHRGDRGGDRDRHRGGRRRGGRGRDRFRDRDRHHGGQRHHGEGQGEAPATAEGGAAPEQAHGHGHHHEGGHSHRHEEPRHNFEPAREEGSSAPEPANGTTGDAGDGKPRRGWWKRLTE